MAELSYIELNGESLELADENARERIDTHKSTTGNTSTAGHVKLSSSTSSSSNESGGIAATPLAVKTAYDKAKEAYTKAETASGHVDNTYNPHNVTKQQVGLGNVDNTSDANKPVSAAQQTAIDNAYANSNYYTDQKIAELINGAPSTLDTLKEIADAMTKNSEVVTALNEAIGTKANETEFASHCANKYNPHNVTKQQVGLGNVPNVATNNQTPTYSVANTLAKLTSGEKLSVAFGKIAKATENLIELNTTVNGLNNNLKEHTTFPSEQGGFYPDYQDGKYGYNTDPSRGADTFHPFKSGQTAIKLLAGAKSLDTQTVNIAQLYPDAYKNELSANNFIISLTNWTDRSRSANEGHKAMSKTYSNGVLTINNFWTRSNASNVDHYFWYDVWMIY